MIELFSKNLQGTDRQSSKGNQLKWKDGNLWCKADYTGYEGLAEYTVSELLKNSTLSPEQYVSYQTEQILYKGTIYLGCKSLDFLPDGFSLITLERLFHNFYGQSLYQSVFSISDVKRRVQFLVQQVRDLTGLTDFGDYLCKLLTIDALFLNEDRHTHNIAVLVNAQGDYRLCPFFDHGASLLSDTTLDYPMNQDILSLIPQVNAKTFSSDFDQQLDAAEELYGQTLKFSFDIHTVETILAREPYYPETIKKRILEILRDRIRKYTYLFS